MWCCTTVQATCRKQQTPQLAMEEKEGGGGWIVLFFEVTPFKDNVSVILTPIAGTWVAQLRNDSLYVHVVQNY